MLLGHKEKSYDVTLTFQPSVANPSVYCCLLCGGNFHAVSNVNVNKKEAKHRNPQ